MWQHGVTYNYYNAKRMKFRIHSDTAGGGTRV